MPIKIASSQFKTWFNYKEVFSPPWKGGEQRPKLEEKVHILKTMSIVIR